MKYMKFSFVIKDFMDTTFEDLDLLLSEIDFENSDFSKKQLVKDKLLEWMARFDGRAMDMIEQACKLECEECEVDFMNRMDDAYCNECGSHDIEIER